MSDIQLVLTDFDGTVAEFGKHIVSDVVRQAVIQCENKNIRMIPVTGRYYEMARPVLELLGFEDLGIFDNGASIINCKTGELVWSQWIDAETVKIIAHAMAPLSRLFDYTPEHIVHEPADDEASLINLVDTPASHVYALIPVTNVKLAEQALGAIQGVRYYIAPSTRDGEDDAVGFQINHTLANKFHGAEALRSLIGISKEHTLAIGDGTNDLPLFDNAGLKIAMGNATEELKAAADYIVASVSDDGFAEAMQRFVLK